MKIVNNKFGEGTLYQEEDLKGKIYAKVRLVCLYGAICYLLRINTKIDL